MKKFLSVVLCMLLLFSACAEGRRVKVTGSVLNTPVDATVMLGADEDGCRQLITQAAAIGEILFQLNENELTFKNANGEAFSISGETIQEGLLQYLLSIQPEELHAQEMLSFIRYASGSEIESDIQTAEEILSTALNRFAMSALNLGLVHFYENGDMFISGTNDEVVMLLKSFLVSCCADQQIYQSISELQIFPALGIDGTAAADSIFSALKETSDAIITNRIQLDPPFGDLNLYISREGSVNASLVLSMDGVNLSASLDATGKSVRINGSMSLYRVGSRSFSLQSDETGLLLTTDSGYKQSKLSLSASEAIYESVQSGSYDISTYALLSPEKLIYEQKYEHYEKNICQKLLICPKENTYSYTLNNESNGVSLQADCGEDGLKLLFKNRDCIVEASGREVVNVNAAWDEGSATACLNMQDGIQLKGEIVAGDKTVPVHANIRAGEIDISLGDEQSSSPGELFVLKLSKACDSDQKTVSLYAYSGFGLLKRELSGIYALSNGEMTFEGHISQDSSNPYYISYDTSSARVNMKRSEDGFTLGCKYIEHNVMKKELDISVQKISETRRLVNLKRSDHSINSIIRLTGVWDSIDGSAFDGRITVTNRFSTAYMNLAFTLKDGAFESEIAVRESGKEHLTLHTKGTLTEHCLTGKAECVLHVTGYAPDEADNMSMTAIDHAVAMEFDFTFDLAGRTLCASITADGDGLALAWPALVAVNVKDQNGALEISVSVSEKTMLFTLDRGHEEGDCRLNSALTLPNGSTLYSLDFRADAENHTHEGKWALPGQNLVIESSFDGNIYSLVLTASDVQRSLTVSHAQQGEKTYITCESTLTGEPVIFLSEETIIENGEKEQYITLSQSGNTLFALTIQTESIPDAFTHVEAKPLTADDICAFLVLLSEQLFG